MEQSINSTIAVFIDSDNVSPKDMPLIINEIKNYGRIIISRIYTDWSKESNKNWLNLITELGLEPIQCERVSGKNSSDMRIAVDVMKVLYNQPTINIFYLVTSDSDFRHLIPEIKLLNKQVNVIGKQLSKALINMSDIATQVEVLKTSNNIIVKQQDIKTYKSEIETLLEEKNSIELSKIKTILVRKYQFDHRAYGCTQLSKFFENNYSDVFKIVKKGTGGCYLENL